MLCSQSCVSGKPYLCAGILIGTSPKSEIVFTLQKIIVRIMASATPGVWRSQGIVHLPQEYIFLLLNIYVNNLKYL